MKQPKKYPSWDLIDGELVYKVKDIEPLLNELVRLKADEKPFPSYQDFERDCMLSTKTDWNRHIMYNYFAQFGVRTVEVFPEVGKEYEGRTRHLDSPVKGILQYYCIDGRHCHSIRPVSTPTREEVIAQVESKLKSNKLIFDRELVEQFLNILKGQDNDL